MKEKKFRAWDEDFGKMMYEFHTGYSVSMDYGLLKVGSRDGNGDYFELDVMDYIGLEDINGKEIYEGDFLAASEELPLTGRKPKTIMRFKKGLPYKVSFHEGSYIITRSSRHIPKPLSSLIIRINGFEVVGNIYLNKELLKK